MPFKQLEPYIVSADEVISAVPEFFIAGFVMANTSYQKTPAVCILFIIAVVHGQSCSDLASSIITNSTDMSLQINQTLTDLQAQINQMEIVQGDINAQIVAGKSDGCPELAIRLDDLTYNVTTELEQNMVLRQVILDQAEATRELFHNISKDNYGMHLYITKAVEDMYSYGGIIRDLNASYTKFLAQNDVLTVLLERQTMSMSNLESSQVQFVSLQESILSDTYEMMSHVANYTGILTTVADEMGFVIKSVSSVQQIVEVLYSNFTSVVATQNAINLKVLSVNDLVAQINASIIENKDLLNACLATDTSTYGVTDNPYSVIVYNYLPYYNAHPSVISTIDVTQRRLNFDKKRKIKLRALSGERTVPSMIHGTMKDLIALTNTTELLVHPGDYIDISLANNIIIEVDSIISKTEL